MLKKNLLAVAILSAVSVGASAYGLNNSNCFCPHFYVGIEGGYSASSEANIQPDFVFDESLVNITIPDNTDWKRDIGSSGVYGLFLGYQLNQNLGVQVTYDNRNSFEWRVPVSAGSLFPDLPFELYQAKLKNQTILFDVKLAPTVNWCGFVPYVKAGIGWSRNKFGEVRDVNVGRVISDDFVPGLEETTAETIFDIRIDGESRTRFAWDAGVGVDYSFNKCFSVGLGYRVVDTNEFKSGSHSRDVLLEDSDVELSPFSSDHVFLHEVVANVTYNFG